LPSRSVFIVGWALN